MLGIVLVIVVAGRRAGRVRRPPGRATTRRASARWPSRQRWPGLPRPCGRRSSRPDPTAALQPYAERVRADTEHRLRRRHGPDRTRYTHPTPRDRQAVRRRPRQRAATARSSPRVYTGTLGPSVRAVVPVSRRTADESSRWSRSGITQQTHRPSSWYATLLLDPARRARPRAGRSACVGAVAGQPRLRRQTARAGRARDRADVRVLRRGAARGPRGAAAASTTERPVELVNDEARRLLDRPGRRARSPRSPTSACRRAWSPAAARRTGASPTTSTSPATGCSWSSSSPAPLGGPRTVGAVVTLRDHTELQVA